jgi:hypothetical protein
MPVLNIGTIAYSQAVGVGSKCPTESSEEKNRSKETLCVCVGGGGGRREGIGMYTDSEYLLVAENHLNVAEPSSRAIPYIRYHEHKNQLLHLILNQGNFVPIFVSHFVNIILLLFSRLHICLPNDVLPSDFSAIYRLFQLCFIPLPSLLP